MLLPARINRLIDTKQLQGNAPSLLVHALAIIGLLLLSSITAIAEDSATLSGTISQITERPLVIYLEQLSGLQIAGKHEDQLAKINSHNNRFTPRFQVVRTFSHVEISNDDPFLHNTHLSEAGMTLFNVATPIKDKTVRKILPRPGLFDVRCDIHPWMKAKIAVVASPYYSVMWEPGHFEIRNIPPGNYKLHIQQSAQEEIIKPITFASNEKKSISSF